MKTFVVLIVVCLALLTAACGIAPSLQPVEQPSEGSIEDPVEELAEESAEEPVERTSTRGTASNSFHRRFGSILLQPVASPESEQPASTESTATETAATEVAATEVAATEVAATETAPTPTSSEAKKHPSDNRQRCLHWALNTMPPLVYSRFEALDPDSMSDIERALWAKTLLLTSADEKIYLSALYDKLDISNPVMQWCVNYWSESLSASNAPKRNEIFKNACFAELVRDGLEYELQFRHTVRQHPANYGLPDIPDATINQYIRALSWTELEAESLMALDEKPHQTLKRLDPVYDQQSDYYSSNMTTAYPAKSAPQHIIEGWDLRYAMPDACKMYYPQISFGRWVPFDEQDYEQDYGQDRLHSSGHLWGHALDLRNTQGDHYEATFDELLEDVRQHPDWPDWADDSDRSPWLYLTPPQEPSVRNSPKLQRALSIARGIVQTRMSDPEVISIEPTTWDNGALGCPKQGFAYTAALVPGHRVVFQEDGDILTIHINDQAGCGFIVENCD